MKIVVIGGTRKSGTTLFHSLFDGHPDIILPPHDLNVFYAQLIEFRKWMKQRGYENKPLIISEYGILLSEEHGYTPDYIASYLFHTLQIILLSYDCDLGNPQDDYRIVQEVSWFSANYVPHANSMLFDENKNLTEVGKAFHRFIKDFLNDTR